LPDDEGGDDGDDAENAVQHFWGQPEPDGHFECECRLLGGGIAWLSADVLDRFVLCLGCWLWGCMDYDSWGNELRIRQTYSDLAFFLHGLAKTGR
jgi:hypothetical protein